MIINFLSVILCAVSSYYMNSKLLEVGVPIWAVCIISLLYWVLFPFKLFDKIQEKDKDNDAQS